MAAAGVPLFLILFCSSHGLPPFVFQLVSEKVGGAEGTKLDDDFKEMEKVGNRPGSTCWSVLLSEGPRAPPHCTAPVDVPTLAGL